MSELRGQRSQGLGVPGEGVPHLLHHLHGVRWGGPRHLGLQTETSRTDIQSVNNYGCGALHYTPVRSAGGEELDGEYEAFLDGMGIGGKKVKLDDDKPYVPPMGSVESRFGQITKSKPRLMLTDGSAAPGAASAAVR